MNIDIRYRLSFVFVFCCLFVVVACEETDNLPSDRQWISPHFVYHARESDPGVCDTTLDYLEYHFNALQSYLGFEWKSADRIEYFKFLDRKDYELNSASPDSAGCMLTINGEDPTIHAYQIMEQHELIHAYLYASGTPPDLLAEGMAHTLSPPFPVTTENTGHYPGLPSFNVSFEEAVSADVSAGAPVKRTKWWTGYLLKHYGPEAVLNIYAAWRDGTPISQVDDIFEAEIGITATDLWNSMSGITDPKETYVPVWQCVDNPLLLDDEFHVLTSTCDEPTASRTFEIDTPSDILFHHADGSRFRLGSCNKQPVPDAVHGYLSKNPYETVVHLQPGKYFVEPDRPYDTTQIAASIISPGFLSNAPQKLDPFTLSKTTVIHIPADGNSWYARYNTDTVSDITIKASRDDPSDLHDIVIEQCEGFCTDNDGFGPIASDYRIVVKAGEYMLKVTASPKRDRFVSLVIQE